MSLQSFVWDLILYAHYFNALIGLFILTRALRGYIINSLPEQNFKEKYNAKWALVTGASSGIGKSFVEKLASQNINVILAALPDKLLDEAVTELSTKYPNLEFRKCGVDLTTTDPEIYMEPLRKASEGVEIELVFCNAGYAGQELFVQKTITAIQNNLVCLAYSQLYVAHYFARKMIENAVRNGRAKGKGKIGLIEITASAAAYFPVITCEPYAGSKALVSSWGDNLAIELAPEKIDVVTIHPNVVRTRIFSANNVKDHGSLSYMQAFSLDAIDITSLVFKSAGKFAHVNAGILTYGLTILFACVDYSLLVTAAVWQTRLTGSAPPDVTALKKAIPIGKNE